MLKKSILDSITRFVLSGTCAASFLTIPVQPLSAQDCCFPSDCCEQDPCCNGGSNWGKTALIIGGAAVVGGIAGAIAGRSSGHRGHDGDSGDDGERGARGPRGLPGTTGATGATGSTGPTGPSPFEEDTGESLIFNPIPILSGLIILPPGDVLTFTPFVSAPDGEVFAGDSRTIGPFVDPTAITGGLIGEFDPISINNPVFGTYHVGIQVSFVEGDTSILAFVIDSNATVQASRDNSVTLTESSNATASIIGPGAVDGVQTDSGFTYGPTTDIP